MNDLGIIAELEYANLPHEGDWTVVETREWGAIAGIARGTGEVAERVLPKEQLLYKCGPPPRFTEPMRPFEPEWRAYGKEGNAAFPSVGDIVRPLESAKRLSSLP